MSTTDRVLDVREVEGPPFGVITDALDDLDPETTLTLVNSFEPRPLYDVLTERGFSYETTQVADDEWRIEIERA